MKRILRVAGIVVGILLTGFLLGRIDAQVPPMPEFVGTIEPYVVANNGLVAASDDSELEKLFELDDSLEDAINSLARTGRDHIVDRNHFDNAVDVAHRLAHKSLEMPVWQSRPLYEDPIEMDIADAMPVSMMKVLLASAHVEATNGNLEAAVSRLETVGALLARSREDPHAELIDYVLYLALKEYVMIAALGITDHRGASDRVLTDISTVLDGLLEANNQFFDTAIKNEYLFARASVEALKTEPEGAVYMALGDYDEAPGWAKRLWVRVAGPYVSHPNRLLSRHGDQMALLLEGVRQGSCGEDLFDVDESEGPSFLAILAPNSVRHAINLQNYTSYISRRCLTDFFIESARIAVAMRRYQLHSDEMPVTLEDLSPRFLIARSSVISNSHSLKLDVANKLVVGILKGSQPADADELWELKRARCGNRNAECVYHINVSIDYAERQRSLSEFYELREKRVAGSGT